MSNRTEQAKKIYRGFEEGSDKIEINTDTRSNKIEEIKHFSFSEGTDGGISSSKYCYISGFDATRYISLYKCTIVFAEKICSEAVTSSGHVAQFENQGTIQIKVQLSISCPKQGPVGCPQFSPVG
ncbi:pyridoxine/pyridoxamine 5'-phosphate oxidase 2-like protein [Carex littledalei]|uniref:Pyridoxine/pyridoxamine 5'-phosphate oxidase 2-like protein n=1 Tax=Carex littledalei TaxID=544730 RepID=A0A833VK05_9POAL|nr:pyridoxine/pyridoxamine 5'-phosphate oxidase 2-like protein [Carex littledalei]